MNGAAGRMPPDAARAPLGAEVCCPPPPHLAHTGQEYGLPHLKTKLVQRNPGRLPGIPLHSDDLEFCMRDGANYGSKRREMHRRQPAIALIPAISQAGLTEESQIVNSAKISANVTFPARITSSPAPPIKMLDSPLPISMSFPAPPIRVMPEMSLAICSAST